MKISEQLRAYKTFAISANGGLSVICQEVSELAEDVTHYINDDIKVEASTHVGVATNFTDITGMVAQLFLEVNDITDDSVSIQWYVENITPIPEFVQEWMGSNGWVYDEDDGSDAFHEERMGN